MNNKVYIIFNNNHKFVERIYDDYVCEREEWIECICSNKEKAMEVKEKLEKEYKEWVNLNCEDEEKEEMLEEYDESPIRIEEFEIKD